MTSEPAHPEVLKADGGTDASSTRPRNIVLFYKSLVTTGGAERLLLQEWQHLQAMGHSVKILTFKADTRALYGFDERIKDDLIICGLPTWSLRMMQAALFLRRFKADVAIVASGFIEIYFLSLLLRLPYILHYHLPCSMSHQDYLKFSSPLRDRFEWLCNRTPYAAEFRTMRDTLSLRQRVSYELRGRLGKTGIDRAKCILVLSDYAKQEAEHLFRAPVVNLQGALDAGATAAYRGTAAFDDAAVSHPLILTVSRLVRHKRVDTAIKAFADIARTMPGATQVIIGTGIEHDRLSALIAELGLQGRCRLLGYVNDDDLRRWYKTCDLFVSVDWADYRLTAFEALAAGKQVIISDESEVNDDLRSTGFVTLTKPEPEPLAHAINTALARSGSLDQQGLGSVLERYSWESYAKAIATRLPR